ncbi:MAG: SHOCT domain-containing protein [Acidimicrobiales bacterium]
MLAYTYPLLNIFWTMFLVFAFVLWIWLLIYIFMDVFRSHDMGGFAKALWVVFIILLPLIGVLVYLIARGGKMQQRSVDAAQQQQQAFDSYVRKTASGGSTADELAKLAQLRDQGAISEDEFQAQKAKLLT